MELVERVEALEEQVDELKMLVKDEHDGLLTIHSAQLLQLRKDVAELMTEVAILKERVNALIDRLEALERRIEAIERRIEALEHRIAALEQKVERMDVRLKRVEILSWIILALLVPQSLIFYLRLLTP